MNEACSSHKESIRFERTDARVRLHPCQVLWSSQRDPHLSVEQKRDSNDSARLSEMSRRDAAARHGGCHAPPTRALSSPSSPTRREKHWARTEAAALGASRADEPSGGGGSRAAGRATPGREPRVGQVGPCEGGASPQAPPWRVGRQREPQGSAGEAFAPERGASEPDGLSRKRPRGWQVARPPPARQLSQDERPRPRRDVVAGWPV